MKCCESFQGCIIPYAWQSSDARRPFEGNERQWKKDYIEVIMLSHISWAREAEKESTYTDLSLDDFVKSQIRLLEPYLVH